MTKSRSDSRRSIEHVFSDSRVPVQLAPQRGVVAPAARMQEAHLVRRAAHADLVAVQQAGEGLHVEVDARRRGRRRSRCAISPASGSTIGRLDRSCGAIGTSTQPAMPRVQDRPAGRQRVGGGAGGRGDDQAVGAQVGDELVADVDRELDHAGGGAAADDHVVQREAFEDRARRRARRCLRASCGCSSS